MTGGRDSGRESGVGGEGADPQITQITQSNGRKKAQMAQMGGNNAQNSKLKTQNYPCRVVGGEVAEDLFDRGLCLPSGTAMTNGDLDRVIETILNSRKKAQKGQK